MHFFTVVVTTLLAFSGITQAAPTINDRVTTIPPPSSFKLRTQVVPGIEDCGTDKNNLWLYSFHTGAGLGDAGLSANETHGMLAYLNGTEQLFGYPNTTSASQGPWSMEVTWVPYSCTWCPP